MRDSDLILLLFVGSWGSLPPSLSSTNDRRSSSSTVFSYPGPPSSPSAPLILPDGVGVDPVDPLDPGSGSYGRGGVYTAEGSTCSTTRPSTGSHPTTN